MSEVERRNALEAAEQGGLVADSMNVRRKILARFKAGEISLEQAQAEIADIKRRARSSGRLTRGDFFKWR